MIRHDVLWWLGQGIALTIGIALSAKYSAEIGGAVGYALCVLVDIRAQVGNGTPTRG